LRRLVLTLSVSLALALLGPAAAQAYWGAIAVDPETGATGLSYTYNSAHAAQNHARHECGEPHCKVAVWVFNGYGAVVQKKNGLYFAGIGRTKHLAFKNARHRAHDSGAHAVAWVFSGLS
jgi:serine/threonine-protein kinase